MGSPGVKMTYLEELREIRTHREATESAISKRLVCWSCFVCSARDIPPYGYGSTTFRKEETRRGLEPDECYCRIWRH